MQDIDSPPGAWTWKEVLLASVVATVFLIGGVAGAALIGNLAGETLVPPVILSLLIVSLEVVALLAGILLAGSIGRKLPWVLASLRPAAGHWLLLAAALSLVFLPIRGIIGLLLQVALRVPEESLEEVMVLLSPEGSDPLGMLALFFLVAVAIPFAEEWFFRGVLYRWLRTHWGIAGSALVSSVAFGLVHGNILMAVTNFILGVVLALVYEYSRSLWPAIVLHGVNNGVAMALLLLFSSLEQVASI